MSRNSASPNLTVNGNFDHCPLCKKDPQSCPHSFAQMAERLWEGWVTDLVRRELRRQETSR